jgi:TonB-dependent starch-binding outer membrane protein SusC
MGIQRYPLLLWGRSFGFLLLFFYVNSVALSQQKITSGKITPELTDSLSGAAITAIGYGIQKQGAVTGSVSTVRSNRFNQGNIQNPIQLIQGKVSGLSITKPGGDPNGSYYMRLRGLNTIYCSTQPLIVIDGMPGESPDNVDPNDIESIDVLKDGSASAIYGIRGSAGVLLITTRKGKKGRAIIDYKVYVTAENVAKNEPAMNASEWRALSNETGLGTDYGTSTNWFSEIEQTALSQVHHLSMSGGNDKTSYRVSVNYRNGEGVLINTGYNQLNGRFNLTQTALNDRLTLDLNLGATERMSQYGFTDAFYYASIFNPTAPVKNSDPAYEKYDGYFQLETFDLHNPVSMLELNKNDGKNNILDLSLRGTFEILDGLDIDAFYSIQSGASLGGQYYDKNDQWGGLYYGGMDRNGLALRQEDNKTSHLFESVIRYKGDLASSFAITALAGYSYQDFTNEGFYTEGGDFLTDAFTYNNLAAALDFKNGIGTVTSYKNSNNLIAFFGRVNLDIKSTWFINASARYEGSSRFGANNKWGLFPAFGAGMDLAQLINAGFMNQLKLRAGYGVTGNQPGNSYMSLQRMGPQGNSYYNGRFIPQYALVSNANPDLKWERKGEFNAGLDFSLFKSKLSGSFDLYASKTTDILFPYEVPIPPNPYNIVWMNIGEMNNSGLELTLNYNMVKKQDFSYDITLTHSNIFKNNLVSLSGTYNGTALHYGTRWLGSVYRSCCEPFANSAEGQPIGELLAFVADGIDPDGNMNYVDQNQDGSISLYDKTIVGNGLPKFLLGFGNTISYKNWDLNIFFRGVFRHYLVNAYRLIYEVPNRIEDYNLARTAADMRSPETGVLLKFSLPVTNLVIENASFVSLDNLSLGYNFSLSNSSLFTKIRLYLAGNNLFYLTHYKGPDPNPRYISNDPFMGTQSSPLVPGVDGRTDWYRTRSVSFGSNIVF